MQLKPNVMRLKLLSHLSAAESGSMLNSTLFYEHHGYSTGSLSACPCVTLEAYVTPRGSG